MNSIRNLARRVSRDERGITGLETAIILIAFVVVATVFAFVVLTAGIFSAERGKETVYAGLAKARGTMELRGGVVVTATGSPLVVVAIQFQMATAAGGAAVAVDSSAPSNNTVIAYRDSAVVENRMIYVATEVVGDGDLLVEPGELFTITLTAADNPSTIGSLAINERWTLEIQTPVGAVIDLTRTMPAQLDPVMLFH